MNSKEYWGLMEAYAEVYAPQEIDEGIRDILPSWAGGKSNQEKSLDRSAAELRRTSEREKADRAAGRASTNPATGLRYTRPTKNTTRQEGQPAVLGGRNVQWSVDKTGKGSWAKVDREGLGKKTVTPVPSPTPSPTPRPTPSPTPSTTAPSTKPYSGSGYKKDTSITDMIGRSQIRQGAPINTGNKSSDVRSMALRGSVGSSTPAKTTPTPVNRATGSKKPGSVYSSFDMFDLVKGHLLDEGYADTEEAAIAIMANMSEEWRESIISEAPGEWFGGLRDKARASRAAQIQASKPTPKPGPTVSSPFAKPASRTDSGRLTTYGAGGGAAAERSGKTRSQVMKQGATNLETRNKSNPGPNFGR